MSDHHHVHPCPDCYCRVPCDDGRCSIDEEEDGVLRGAHLTCDQCHEARLRALPPARVENGWAIYLDDDRNDPLRELAILVDDQGDVYIQVRLAGERGMGPSVRLTASGGAAAAAPGLGELFRAARRAIIEAATGKRSTPNLTNPVAAVDTKDAP